MSKKPKELEALERAFKSLIIMPLCKVSIMLITPSYLADYFAGEPDIVTQVRLSKQLNQPVLLMIDRDLTPIERNQVDRIFINHNVIARIMFDRDRIQDSEKEIFEALKPYGAKDIGCTSHVDG